MTDQSPTTMNGLLHTPEATTDDRLLRVTYSSFKEAEAARDVLIRNGIAEDRINIIQNAADSSGVQSELQPEDRGLVARVRDALLPDDGQTATAAAVRNNEAIMEIRPTKEEVDGVVQLIEASNPSHFDARLQRWRNAG